MAYSDEDSDAPVSPGDVLAGKYRVERVLGAGGMGVVVSATHLELGERVAMKFLLPQAAENPDAGARFLREARAAARIKSEFVARVIDVGRLESGSPYMVMEYLEGGDLGAELERGALPIRDAVDYVIEACHAMAEAHSLGIIHRDLKPQNLFLARRSDGSRSVKVLDFGISKTRELGDASLTKTSTMMGSPYYMSPEQMRSAKDVDHRTDIWALGIVLYQLLSGRLPFHGDTLPELISHVLTDTPRSLCGLRSEVPGALDAAVFRCLEKAPTARFESVGELARALAPFGSRRGRFTLEGVLKITGVQGEIATSQPPSGAAFELGATVVEGTPAAAHRDGAGAALAIPKPAAAVQTATSWVDSHAGAAAIAPVTRRKWWLGGAALVAACAAAFFAVRARPPASASPSERAGVLSAAPPAVRSPTVVVPPTSPTPIVEPASDPIAVAPSASSAGPPHVTRRSKAASTSPARRASESKGTREAARVEPAPNASKKNPLAIELK